MVAGGRGGGWGGRQIMIGRIHFGGRVCEGNLGYWESFRMPLSLNLLLFCLPIQVIPHRKYRYQPAKATHLLLLLCCNQLGL